ncbi:MAG: MCE family protein [Gammaproteobacteria bacterium]|nr:MCE family protein [Gammaproteobacteria bacterium]
METKVNYTIVGAFVVILSAVIVVGIIWLSSGLSLESYTSYMVYMQESVSGLGIDSQVEFNGVEVGKVKSIELNHNNPQLVEVLLSIKSTAPVSRGTEATLATRGLTGLVYIALKDKGMDQQKLLALPGQTYPIIKTAPSIFLRLDTALSRFSASFQKISQSFQSLLDKDNLAAFKSTLKNIQEITGSLAINSHRLEAIVKNIDKGTQKFSPFMQSTTTAMQTLEMQTLPAASHLFTNLDTTANNLSEVSFEIKQDPSILIRGVDRQNLGPGEK